VKKIGKNGKVQRNQFQNGIRIQQFSAIYFKCFGEDSSMPRQLAKNPSPIAFPLLYPSPGA
jgi:hypothetical protein